LTIIKTSLLAAAAAVLAASHGAEAQPVPAFGGQLQQIPPAPRPDNAAPQLEVARPEAATGTLPGGESMVVTALRVTGHTLFPEADLVAAAGFQPGAKANLADLRQMAAGIASFYNRRGYFVAQAYLPAQNIENGVVTIAVIEGRYGKIDLRNQTNLSDGLARNLLHGLDTGAPVANRPLQRRLLLLSDLPGVTVRSTLVPGAAVGDSDLIVEVLPGRRFTGSVEADNAGNRYTGAGRIGATINLNNPTGHGDVASVRVLSSLDGLNYARASYQRQFGALTAGIAYAHIDYRLGREFKPLRASGSAGVASLYVAYPLIRSQNANLQILAGADAKTFKDELGVPPGSARRKTLALHAGLSGDARDGFGGGGRTFYAANWTHGDLDLKTPAVRAADALTARTQGGYDKLELSAARIQTVTGALSLYGAARGQVASGNLDISEKMELGGAYGVRAYPEGEAYGDQGYILTLEARLLLSDGWIKLPGEVQLFAFADAGAVTIAKSPWFAGPNTARRSGAGVGAAWATDNGFVLKATYAHRLGVRATSGPSAPGRGWIQVAKLF
jgi:hemolysin activation/secretion protein